MRNQQRFLLSLLGLGILLFKQIDADSYKSAKDIVTGHVSDEKAEKCLERFYNMMTNAKKDSSQNENGNESSNVNKITQSFWRCMLTSGNDIDKFEINPNASGDERIICPTKDNVKRGISKSRNSRSQSENAIEQIDDFECLPNYDDLTEQLLEQMREEFKKFLQADLDQEYKQESYASLVKKLLYKVTGAIIGEDSISDVKNAIDKRLEPYILEIMEIQLSDVVRMFRRNSNESEIEEFKNGQRSANSFCSSKGLEPTIESVYNSDDGLVELEKMLTLYPEDNEVWRECGTKLLQDFEQLLKIFEDPSLEILPERVMARMQIIYEARSLVISCLDILRESWDAMSEGIDISAAEKVETINACGAANKLAKDLVDYAIGYMGVGDIEPSVIDSLQADGIKYTLLSVTNLYPDLKHLEYFVKRKLRKGILTYEDEYKNSFAWDMVREWQESSIEDVNLRFLTVFASNEILRQGNCALNDIESVSGHWLYDESCNKEVLEDLVIMTSALCKDGLSIQPIYYDHPLLMNYMYIVDKVLLAEIPSCIPVKKNITIPLVARRQTM